MGRLILRIPRTLLAGLGTLVLAAACGPTAITPAPASFEESGVRVTVDLIREGDAVAALRARFEPLTAGYHLYGLDLPIDGIDGAGRPTLVELASTGWTATGPLTADKPTRLQVLDGFDRPFSVYPDGPVVLTLPIRRASGDTGSTELRVRITYMACSRGGICLAPVEGREIVVPSGIASSGQANQA